MRGCFMNLKLQNKYCCASSSHFTRVVLRFSLSIIFVLLIISASWLCSRIIKKGFIKLNQIEYGHNWYHAKHDNSFYSIKKYEIFQNYLIISIGYHAHCVCVLCQRIRMRTIYYHCIYSHALVIHSKCQLFTTKKKITKRFSSGDCLTNGAFISVDVDHCAYAPGGIRESPRSKNPFLIIRASQRVE